ncbi:hypothetical protein ACH4TX_26080 [Streptomyces sp. NPDC021098]|uniref:hypothetical protein n=1 Tax=unclassified Streptomyces TaxID=2593676 RepID=UPI0037BCDD47
MTDFGPERKHGLDADHGPEHANGHRGHGLEKHEVPPPPSGEPMGGGMGGVPQPRDGGLEQTTTPDGPSFPVLPTSEHDKLNQRLRYAVSSFVDAPRGSVEEADALLEEVSARLVDLLAERRRTLRDAWHDGAVGTEETEELRLAMRGYRNVLERLLSV